MGKAAVASYAKQGGRGKALASVGGVGVQAPLVQDRASERKGEEKKTL